jgi:hypothetical protein
LAFCTNDKKAISQNIFVQNSYKIFAIRQKSFKEFAGDFALLAICSLPKFDEIVWEPNGKVTDVSAKH